jgi:transposase
MSGIKRVTPYDEAFRQQMVELVVSGRPVRALAIEFGCSPASIHHWVKNSARVLDLPRGAQVMHAARAVRGAASQMALSHAERDELMKLRKENKALRIERDILSKATAWFAHKSEKTSMMFTGS